MSSISLCHLLGPEAEQRGEVYSAAIDRGQAALMYAEMEAIILRVPEFAGRCNLQRFHKKIEVLEGDGEGSIYEALSSDARRGHGLSPTLWTFDELAQARDRQLLDALLTSLGKRKRSLGIVISTQAPKDDHPLSQLLDDVADDPTTRVQLICAPDDADPFDPEVVRACNPALGIFLDEADVMAAMEMARKSPPMLAAHKNLRLNQRVESNIDSKIVSLETWAKGNAPIEIAAGAVCLGGLDLSKKDDLTALVLAFPRGTTKCSTFCLSSGRR